MFASLDSPASLLKVLVNAHFLLGGLVFGALGAALMRTSRVGWKGRVGWLVAAKYLSSTLLLFPLSIVFVRILPAWLGLDPVGRLPWLAVGFALLALVLSALVEWPFFYRIRGDRWGSLGCSIRANSLTMVLLVAVYLPFCELGIWGLPNSSVIVSGFKVFYLREGGLFLGQSKGSEHCLVSGLRFSTEARLFTRRGRDGWDLWLQDAQAAPQCLLTAVAPESMVIPQQVARHTQTKKTVQTGEPTLAQTYGKPAEGVPETESAWSLRVGQWPWEGLQVSSRDVKGSYSVALDTPLLSWNARCATRLPGEQVLFQMGPYLWVLDLEARQLEVWAKGQGAVVIWPDGVNATILRENLVTATPTERR
ncbi:MAG: hypothetical protein WAT51_07685 [Holophaga sp.]